MAQELITILGESLESITLRSGEDNIFEITINGDLVFSRRETMRYPDLDQVMDAVYQRLG